MAAADARGFDDIRHSRTKIDRSIDGDRDFDRDSRASRGCEGGGGEFMQGILNMNGLI